jgi:hypothetical protein
MVAVKQKAIRAAIEKEFVKAPSQNKPQDPLAALRSALQVVAVSGYVKGIRIARAQVTLEGGTALPLQIGDAGMNLSFHLPESERMTGDFVLGRLAVSDREVCTQAESAFTYDSGKVTIANFRARSFGGKVKCDARLNVESGALYSALFTGTGIDCAAIARLGDTTGRISGKATVKFAFDSSAFVVDSLHGKGTVSISRFEIAGYPFQRSLVTMLLYKGLDHLRFEKFSSTVALRPKLIFENSAVGEGDTLTVKADGWIRADGLLNQKLDCTLSKAGVKTLPEFAQKTLEEGPQGSRVLRCRVYGMIQNPKVSVESKVILQKAVKNMFEDVKNNLQLWMR